METDFVKYSIQITLKYSNYIFIIHKKTFFKGITMKKMSTHKKTCLELELLNQLQRKVYLLNLYQNVIIIFIQEDLT